MNKILKNTLILTAITLIAGLGLGLVHEITLNPIAQAQEKAKKEAWQAVFPDAKLDIQVSVGIQSDGTVTGVSFLSISETAGLGMKAKEPSFYEQYVGKNPTKFAVSKDGGDGEQIDALSGATITSRAVTGAVNAALGYYQNAFGQGGN